MSGIDLYQYESPRLFLLDWISNEQKKDPHISARKLAREMGISHTLLLMLLQGKRPIRLKHALMISKAFKLNTAERLYLQTLIEYESAETPEEKEFVRLWLAELNPERTYRSKELDDYQILSHWVHFAIINMTKLEGFRGTADEIFECLRSKVSINEVRAALGRLESSGLAKRDEEGKLKSTYERLVTRDDVAQKGGREYHKQATELAKAAVEEQELSEREFQSFSLAVKRSQIPFAKELIRKFRSQFVKAIEAEEAATDVYHMNVHFFRLTERREPLKIAVPRTKAPEILTEETV